MTIDDCGEGFDLTRDRAAIDGYLTDASNTRGRAEALARPGSTAEVARILAFCQARGIPLTVTARRTSTTGGPVPEGGWLLSTERFDRVHSVDECDGGVILGEYQRAVESVGRLFPPDPTSRDECSLGGAISCNASGARSFRYGPTRPWVEAVEAVLPNGEIVWADRSTPIPAGWPRLAWRESPVKSAAGYSSADNLLDLLVGQEGTLAVVTRARLRTLPLPLHALSLLAFFPDTGSALAFVERAREGATRPGRRGRPGALDPRAIEYYDENALRIVAGRFPGLPPAATDALFVEVEHGGDPPLGAWWDALAAAGALVDHTVASDDERGRARLRAMRHAVPAALHEDLVRRGMPKVGTDFAVPDDALGEIMAAYRAVDLPRVVFGHIGDNHLHVNLLPRDGEELARAKEIWRDLARRALALGGTISAEHGIGKLKRAAFAEMAGEEAMASFRALKRVVDPAWILGRGTLFEP